MQTTPSFFWKRHPFVRALLPLAAGIAAQVYTGASQTLSLALVAAAIAPLVILALHPVYERWRTRSLQGVLGLLVLLGLGMQLAFHHDIRRHPRWLGKLPAPVAVLVRLDETPQKRTRHYRARATVIKQFLDGQWQPVAGEALLYFPIDSLEKPPPLGGRLVLKGPLQPIPASGNPAGFDFRRYSLYRGITHQAFLRPGNYRLLPEHKAPWLSKWLEQIRQEVLNGLRRHIPGPRECGLAEALLIGYKQDLDPELTQAYSHTGAVHVIAISGMHLGLVYLLLGFLLKPLKRHRHSRWLRALLQVLGLWLFSLLAGASPSVLRAAVMFTGLALGENLQRSASVYNTLAFSAFVLLFINPFWLWDAGFQLSYAALLGILLFQRPLYNRLYLRRRWADAVWKLSTVTLAAQIFTAPVSLYHFHQFPVYFWLSNLVAVPLSSLILFGEILLCALLPLPLLAGWLGQALYGMIRLMNGFIEGVEALPLAVWEGLQLSAVQTGLLLAMPALGASWLFFRNRWGVRLGAACVLLLLTLRLLDFRQKQKQELLIVYQVPRQSALDIFRGRTLFAFGDSALLADPNRQRFFLEPARIRFRAGRREVKRLSENGAWLLQAGGRKIWLLRSAPRPDSLTPADLLLLSGEKAPYPQRLPAPFYKQVVADAAVPARVIRRWERYCDSLQLPFHPVSREGAFVMQAH